jgi:histidyl-tRNA synthetase
MLADAELLGVATSALRQLGFTGFRIKLNNRKLLVGLAEYAGVPPAQAGGVYRAIDKLEKVGEEAVRAELLEEGLAEPAASRLLELVQRKATSAAELLASVQVELADFPAGIAGAQELAELMEYASALGITPEECQVDLSMVRGLEYYTGPILEAVVEKPRIGSIIGGGRYDGLVGLMGGPDLPATGLSFGLERIIDVLEELEMAPPEARQTAPRVLVTVFNPEGTAESLRLAQELRSAGIRTEVYLGKDRLGPQLRYASRKGIPFVAILGPDEVGRGEVTVKVMAGEGAQVVIDRKALAAWVTGR